MATHWAAKAVVNGTELVGKTRFPGDSAREGTEDISEVYVAWSKRTEGAANRAVGDVAWKILRIVCEMGAWETELMQAGVDGVGIDLTLTGFVPSADGSGLHEARDEIICERGHLVSYEGRCPDTTDPANAERLQYVELGFVFGKITKNDLLDSKSAAWDAQKRLKG